MEKIPESWLPACGVDLGTKFIKIAAMKAGAV